MKLGFSLCLAACLTISAATGRGEDLLGPTPLLVGDAQLDVEHMGHAAPWVGDVDGDGAHDLLVGEYYQGRLRVYPNQADNRTPRFTSFHVLRDGDPTGRIHAS